MEKQDSKMYITETERKERNLPSTQEQIDRWNKFIEKDRLTSRSGASEFTRANGLETTFQK